MSKDRIEACDGFCNDVGSLITNALLLDSISRARLSPLSAYGFKDHAIFKRCNNLMADLALQTRLMSTVLNRKFSIPNKPFIQISNKRIKTQKYDVQLFNERVNQSEKKRINYEEHIALLSYHLRVAKVKTSRKVTHVNLIDTCSFIAHAEKSYFSLITDSCLGSKIVIHLSKNKNYKEHSNNKYNGRLYEICLSSFALCAATLFQVCVTCGGEYGTLIIDENGYPNWGSLEGKNDDD